MGHVVRVQPRFGYGKEEKVRAMGMRAQAGIDDDTEVKNKQFQHP